MLRIKKAAIMPGNQPKGVNNNTIKNEPKPLSATARGGKMIASKTLNIDIVVKFLFHN